MSEPPMPNYYHPNDDGLCRYCGGTGWMGSRIHHVAPGFTIAVDRKTEPCPKCNADLDEQMDHRHREDET